MKTTALWRAALCVNRQCVEQKKCVQILKHVYHFAPKKTTHTHTEQKISDERTMQKQQHKHKTYTKQRVLYEINERERKRFVECHTIKMCKRLLLDVCYAMLSVLLPGHVELHAHSLFVSIIRFESAKNMCNANIVLILDIYSMNQKKIITAAAE